MHDKIIGLTNANPDELSETTRSLLALGPTVLARWKEMVRSEIAMASDLRPPILENTMPSFHESMALLLTPEYQQRGGVDVSIVAAEHGSERARLTGYDMTTLIHELQLFRRAFFETAAVGPVMLTPEQGTAVHSCIDSAIRGSANAFAGVQAALREQFAAALVHDLRTPLSNAHLAAELIERASSLAQAQSLAKKVLRNTARIDDMARELLDNLLFVGGEDMPLRITQFDMAELAREIAEHAATFHGVDIKLDAQSVQGYWCRASLQRTLENLVSNAIKYGDMAAPISLSVTPTETRVKVSVHNEGNPIPLEETESLFQLYHRAEETRRNTTGWGVGLPFVRRIAEAHGGSVLVSSTVDEGTTFAFDIPMDARPFRSADQPST